MYDSVLYEPCHDNVADVRYTRCKLVSSQVNVNTFTSVVCMSSYLFITRYIHGAGMYSNLIYIMYTLRAGSFSYLNIHVGSNK